MKITKIETLRTEEFANVLWVRVYTDAGIIGLGYGIVTDTAALYQSGGSLYMGSGGIVHNLGRVDWTNSLPPPAWAASFDELVRTKVVAGEDAALIDYGTLGEAARLSIPTPEHYLPLLYVLGARHPGEAASIPLSGFDLGTISMTAVQVG